MFRVLNQVTFKGSLFDLGWLLKGQIVDKEKFIFYVFKISHKQKRIKVQTLCNPRKPL